MERLPRDIAELKLHRDIVKLLDEYQPKAFVSSAVVQMGLMLAGHAKNSRAGCKRRKKTSSLQETWGVSHARETRSSSSDLLQEQVRIEALKQVHHKK